MDLCYTYCPLCGIHNNLNWVCPCMHALLLQINTVDLSFGRAGPAMLASTTGFVPLAAPISHINNPLGAQQQPPIHQHEADLLLADSPRSSSMNREEMVMRIAPIHQQFALREILGSSWWRDNKQEPDDEFGQFVLRLRESPTRFRCQANGCNRVFSRRDRAIDHFRDHVDHRPYACETRCGDRTCTLAFLAHRDLQSHITRPIAKCSRCSRDVTKRNLSRHQTSRKCRRASVTRTTQV